MALHFVQRVVITGNQRSNLYKGTHGTITNNIAGLTENYQTGYGGILGNLRFNRNLIIMGALDDLLSDF